MISKRLKSIKKTSYTCYDKPGMKFPKAMKQIPQGRFVVESHAALSLLIINWS